MTTTFPGGIAKHTEYKGVAITEWWYGLTPFQFSIYPMFKSVGREKDVGGGGCWRCETLDEAHAEIDRFLAKLGLPEVPAPQPWKPDPTAVAVSLSPAALAARIRSLGDAIRIAQAIDNPMLQVVDGLPLLAWFYENAPGAMRFGRLDEDGRITAVVGVVNAPESRRAEYTSDHYPCPTTLLMVG